VLSLLGGSVKHDSSHPIANFLFGYYHFRPKALLEYSPGMHTLLQDASPDDPCLARRGVLVRGGQGSPRGVVWAPYGPKGGVSHKHEAALRLTLHILTNTLQRPPNFFWCVPCPFRPWPYSLDLCLLLRLSVFMCLCV
jgi:hypothetical protein